MLIEEFRKPAPRKRHGKMYIESKMAIRLKCDVCGTEFERDKNIRYHRSRTHHNCSWSCFLIDTRNDGHAGKQRCATNMKKYGAPHKIATKEIATKAARLAQSKEANAKRRETRKKNLENYSIQLKRGLTINRSREEVEFFTLLSIILDEELNFINFMNGRWIDAYSARYNCWMQYDGLRWHQRPERIIIDIEQNAWFKAQGKTLLRITNIEAKKPNALKEFAEKVKDTVQTS